MIHNSRLLTSPAVAAATWNSQIVHDFHTSETHGKRLTDSDLRIDRISTHLRMDDSAQTIKQIKIKSGSVKRLAQVQHKPFLP